MEKLSNKNTFLKLLIVTCTVICFSLECHGASLSKGETKLIEKYINNSSVEDAVGQILMVGLPADFNNYKDVRKLDEILIDIGVGSVIVHNYNYFYRKEYPPNMYLSSIIEFNNAIQDKALSGKLSLPLLVATDFESPNVSSIRSGLIIPPSALAISATRNKEYINYIGRLVGLQLKNIGINIILGPVLDTYNIKQGNRSTLQDRCFASTPHGVVTTASYFIKGLKESGISIFAKHFPSHGSVESNPHDNVIPKYEGSTQQLEDDIKPFLYFKKSLDGIMSSHIVIDELRKNEIATFSSEFITGKLKKMGFKDQIIITDDLSSMGAIRRYLLENPKENFSSIAIKAFTAGHDLLVFSNFSECDKRSKFTLNDLKDVKNSLAKYIKGNASAEKQFRESLRKIISLKARLAKDMGQSVETVLNNKDKFPVYRIAYYGREALTRSQEFLKKIGNPNIDDGEKLVKEIIRKSSVLINKRNEFNLTKSPVNSKIVFCVYKEFLDFFKETFGAVYKNAEFIAIPQLKSGSDFKALKYKVNDLYERANLIIYTVLDKSDSDFLTFLQIHKKKFSEKLVVFCHNSPVILDNNVLKDATIISNFTNHQLSFTVDIEILRGDLMPNELKNLPINIGEYGKFYNVGNTTWIEPADISSFEEYFPRYNINSNYESLIRRYNLVIPKNLRTLGFCSLYLVVVVILLVFWASVSKNFIKKQRDNANSVAEKDEVLSLKFWIHSAMVHYKITLPLFFVLSLIILFYLPETSDLVGGLVNLIKVIKGKG
ncbi:MAG: hypothetical protein FJ242_01690 [Nitrospira sp.]|nr:hypothetical protein [Nitrospira sp.]